MKKIGTKKLKRLARLLILINTYQEDPEWDTNVRKSVINEIFELSYKWKFPPSIFNISNYQSAIDFVLKEK